MCLAPGTRLITLVTLMLIITITMSNKFMPNGRMWVWMYNNYYQLDVSYNVAQICEWPDHPIIECKVKYS